jgi:hypothetical protein
MVGAPITAAVIMSAMVALAAVINLFRYPLTLWG